MLNKIFDRDLDSDSEKKTLHDKCNNLFGVQDISCNFYSRITVSETHECMNFNL